MEPLRSSPNRNEGDVELSKNRLPKINTHLSRNPSQANSVAPGSTKRDSSSLLNSLSTLGLRHTSRTPSFKNKRQSKDYKNGLLMLKQLFRELAANSSTGGNTIDKNTLLKYLPLPGLLGERLFAVFDNDHSGGIDFAEFTFGLAIVYGGSQEEKRRFLFNMYDLDGNGLVEKEELRTLLTHVSAAIKSTLTAPDINDLSTSNLDETDLMFRDALLQKKVDAIVNVTFDEVVNGTLKEMNNAASSGNQDGLTYEQFVYAVSRSKGILEVLNLFYVDTMPELPVPRESLDPRLLRHKELFYGTPSTTVSLSASSDCDSLISLPGSPFASTAPTEGKVLCCPMCAQEIRCFHCPRCGDNLSTTESNSNFNYCIDCRWSTKDIRFCFSCGQPLQFELASLNDLTTSNLKDGKEATDGKPSCARSAEFTPKRINDRKGAASRTIHPVLKEKFTHSLTDAGQIFDDALKCGYLYKVGRKLGFLTKRHVVVKDRFLYTFKKKTSTAPGTILYLQGAFVGLLNESIPKYYCIEIIFPNGKQKKFYATSPDDRTAWMQVLQKATRCTSIHDTYVLQERIGWGQFSVVHRAVHKSTLKEVAVKILSKTNLNYDNQEFLRNEVCVMKLIAHSNVVRLLDVVDSSKYLYLVMEYVGDGDLSRMISALKGRPVSEDLIRYVMYHVLNGISYIHYRGIVHRDVKPENILLRLNFDILSEQHKKHLGMKEFPQSFEESIRVLNDLLLKRNISINQMASNGQRIGESVGKFTINRRSDNNLNGGATEVGAPKMKLLFRSHTHQVLKEGIRPFCRRPTNRFDKGGVIEGGVSTNGVKSQNRKSSKWIVGVKHKFSDDTYVGEHKDVMQHYTRNSFISASNLNKFILPFDCTDELHDDDDNHHILRNNKTLKNGQPSRESSSSGSDEQLHNSVTEAACEISRLKSNQLPLTQPATTRPHETSKQRDGISVVLPPELFCLKITDFGLSKLLAPTLQANEALGTLAYAAPEVLRGDPYRTSIDMWSIGVMTYESLCGGELPFIGKSDDSLIAKVQKCDYSMDRPAFKGVSDAAKDFIRRLLTINPKKRPTCAEALKHEWLADVGK